MAMQKAKNGVSNHPADQQRCILGIRFSPYWIWRHCFTRFPFQVWFGSAFLCTDFCQVSQVSALCLDVHVSLGALWQTLAPFGGSGQQQSMPVMLSTSGHSWLTARAHWLGVCLFAASSRTAGTAAIQWHFGALCDMNWLPSPRLLGGNTVNDLNLCTQRKL